MSDYGSDDDLLRDYDPQAPPGQAFDPRVGMLPAQLAELRLAAENVYNTVDGRMIFDELFEDLQLYDEPRDEHSAILHGFAMRVMQKYFGRLRFDREHRSQITAAIMRVSPVDDTFEETE